MSIDVDKKRGRGRPKVASQLVCSRIAEPLLGQLDAYISAQPEPRPSRPEAVRRLLQKALASGDKHDTAAAVAERIEHLEAKVAGIPEPAEPSPQAGIDIMRKALAEAELTGLRKKRKRVRKPSSK